MKTIDLYLARLVRFLWLMTLYVGLNQVWIGFQNKSFLAGDLLFFLGVFQLVASYGLFKKTNWAWRLTFWTALVNLIFFLIYPVPVGIFLNLLISYVAFKFKEKLGGTSGDKILPKKAVF